MDANTIRIGDIDEALLQLTTADYLKRTKKSRYFLTLACGTDTTGNTVYDDATRLDEAVDWAKSKHRDTFKLHPSTFSLQLIADLL